eukprot:354200-Amphidinium_carterae.4
MSEIDWFALDCASPRDASEETQDPPPKRVRLLASPHVAQSLVRQPAGPTTWTSRLMSVCRDELDVIAGAGTLVMESACSGLGSPLAALRVIRGRGVRATSYQKTPVTSTSKSKHAWNANLRACDIIQVIVCLGVTSLRWTEHKEVGTMLKTLRWIAWRRPSAGVIENVAGLQEVADGDTRSPLQWILQELHDANFAADYVVTDLALFHHAQRGRRTCLLHTAVPEFRVLSDPELIA